MTTETTKIVHRLAATELLYRATLHRRPMSEVCFRELQSDIAHCLAEGRVVCIRAVQFGERWEYELNSWKAKL